METATNTDNAQQQKNGVQQILLLHPLSVDVISTIYRSNRHFNA